MANRFNTDSEDLELLVEIDEEYPTVQYKGFVFAWSDYDQVYQIFSQDDWDNLDEEDRYPEWETDTDSEAKEWVNEYYGDVDDSIIDLDDDLSDLSSEIDNEDSIEDGLDIPHDNIWYQDRFARKNAFSFSYRPVRDLY